MNFVIRSVGFALLIGALALFAPGRARAQSVTCTTSGATLAFGSINVLLGASTASTTVTATCTNSGASSATVEACLSIGTGTGTGSTAAARLLSVAGGSTLPIAVRQTAASASEIGDGTTNAQEGPVSVTVAASGTATGTFTLAGIIAMQSTLPLPGTYASTFTGTDFELIYTTSAAATCTQVAAATPTTVQSTLTANATIPNQCTVGTTSMAFPTGSLLTTYVDATANIIVTCNATSAASVALDNGSNSGTGPTTRKMVSGGNSITYGIYQDSGRSLPWGSTNGTNTESTTITGASSTTLTAYGRVPVQTATPGFYQDVVNVTVSY